MAENGVYRMIRIIVGLIVGIMYAGLVVWMESKERHQVKLKRELEAEEWAKKKWEEHGQN